MDSLKTPRVGELNEDYSGRNQVQKVPYWGVSSWCFLGVLCFFLCRSAAASSSSYCYGLFDVLESYALEKSRWSEINAVAAGFCDDVYSRRCEKAMNAIGERNALMLHRLSLWESGGDIGSFSSLLYAIDDISAYNLSGTVPYVWIYMFASAKERSVLTRKLESQDSFYTPKYLLSELSKCAGPAMIPRPAGR